MLIRNRNALYLIKNKVTNIQIRAIIVASD